MPPNTGVIFFPKLRVFSGFYPLILGSEGLISSVLIACGSACIWKKRQLDTGTGYLSFSVGRYLTLILNKDYKFWRYQVYSCHKVSNRRRESYEHRLNMELDHQSLFGLLYTVVLIGWDSPSPPAFGLITRALLVSQDRPHCYKTEGEIPVHTHDDAGRQRSTTGKYESGVNTWLAPAVFDTSGIFLWYTAWKKVKS